MNNGTMFLPEPRSPKNANGQWKSYGINLAPPQELAHKNENIYYTRKHLLKNNRKNNRNTHTQQQRTHAKVVYTTHAKVVNIILYTPQRVTTPY